VRRLPGNRFIVTANYWPGSFGIVPIEQDGSLGPRTGLAALARRTRAQPQGTGGSRTHMIVRSTPPAI
jgi:6-phosphogluconolactonase (cycloisomerase 2 family)